MDSTLSNMHTLWNTLPLILEAGWGEKLHGAVSWMLRPSGEECGAGGAWLKQTPQGDRGRAQLCCGLSSPFKPVWFNWWSAEMPQSAQRKPPKLVALFESYRWWLFYLITYPPMRYQPNKQFYQPNIRAPFTDSSGNLQNISERQKNAHHISYGRCICF